MARPTLSPVVRGILLIVLATLLFVCMNVSVKYLRATLPTLELIWARSLGHFVFVIAIFAPAHGGWRLLSARRGNGRRRRARRRR
ncbi:MAG: hypothetical protein ACRELS_08585 [Candidatus Rokuibacteriota bacterium]